MPASSTHGSLPATCVACGSTKTADDANSGWSEAGDAPCPQCGLLLTASHECASRIKQILSTTLGVTLESIGDEFDFRTLAGDSLGAMEVVMALEEELEVSVPDAELKRVETVADLVQLAVRSAAAAS